MNELNYTLFRGDTFSKTIIIKSTNVEITQIYFTMKAHLNDTKSVVQKQLNKGIEKIADKKYLLTVLPEDTDDLKANGTLYDYDIEIVAGDFKKTVLKGTIRLESDVTRTKDEKANIIVKVDTSDADADAASILLDKTAYVDGQKIIGTLDLSNLIPENIKKGIIINGVVGTYSSESEV